MEASPPGVLIISPDTETSCQFINALCAKSNNKGNVKEFEKKEKELQATINDLVEMNYCLDTKYYTAEVKLVVLSYAQIIQVFQSSAVEYLEKTKVKSVEGIIYLINMTNNKKEGLYDYLKCNKDIISMHSPNILMSYVNRSESDSTNLFEALDFDNNEAFIEISDSDLIKELEPNTSEVKSNLEDKTGISRVIEVLECNLWPNMVKKDKNTAPNSSASAIINKKTAVKSEQIQEINEDSQLTQEGYLLMKDDTTIQSTEESKKGDAGKEGKGSIGEGQTIEIEEMDKFTKLFDSMKKLKDDGKGMTDEQRKARAEALITQLMANFGVDDEDDEYENDEFPEDKLSE